MATGKLLAALGVFFLTAACSGFEWPNRSVQ